MRRVTLPSKPAAVLPPKSRSLASALLCGLVIICCSGQRVLVDLDDVGQLRADAADLERRGEIEAAADLYLACLDACPSVGRINGEDLRRLWAKSPAIEHEVWALVGVIEARVQKATIADKALRDDALGLASMYQAWRRGDRARMLLDQMKSGQSPDAVYEEVLISLAANLGDGLAIDTHDAELLRNRLSAELGLQRELEEAGGDSPDWRQYEPVRQAAFVAYASAMLASGHRAVAEEALAEQVGEDSAKCGSLLDRVRRLDAAPVAALVCARCAADRRCAAQP